MKSRVAGLMLALALLAGCSQVAQLQPVAGAEIAAVRAATNQVLVNRGVELMVAPVCREEQDKYRCEGSTVQGEAISAIAEVLTEPGPSPATSSRLRLRISVAGQQIFDGLVDDVLTQNARARE